MSLVRYRTKRTGFPQEDRSGGKDKAMMPGNGNVLNLYITRGDIWGMWGTHTSIDTPRAGPLRDKLLGAMAQHCRPNRLDVSDKSTIGLTREVLSTMIARSITVENIVLHQLASIIETGKELLARQLGQESGRVIVLVASPYLLGGPDDVKGDHAVCILTHALSEIYRLSPGVYVTDGTGHGPLLVDQAQFLGGRLIEKPC